ncbi:MAG: hypothetical protein P8Y03_13705, partial [Anaerolineales bacterium]
MTTDISIPEAPTISIQDDRLTPLVRKIMRVDDITWGQGKQNYIVRYRGNIVGETATAYEKLS